MNAFILFASLTAFFALQAIYWIWASRRSAKDEALVDRLGVDERVRQGDTLLREEADGAVSKSLAQLLLDAGEEPNVGAFFSRMALFFCVTFTLILLITQSVFGAIMLGLISTVLPLFLVLRKKRKRMERIEEQLPEALEVMTISLRAGHSLDQTIRVTAAELESPIGDEFRRVAEECELGRPLDEALVQMTERLETARTVRTFVVSVLVLRQTGGNLIEVLESIIDTMRQQSQYERKLRAMTAEGRSSSRMLAGLPPTFVTVVWLAQPQYVGKMVTNPMGQMLLALALMLYGAGLFWVRRLTNPKS